MERTSRASAGWSAGPADPRTAVLNQIDLLLTALGIGEAVRRGVLTTVVEHAADPAGARRVQRTAAPTTIGDIAGLFYRHSRRRADILGSDLMQDGCWHMLLDLFAAGEAGRAVSVSSLGIASGLPATTALRHIEALVRRDLIRRTGDPDDRRRSWVTLAPDTRVRMAEMIVGFTVPRPDQSAVGA